jgi:3-dehydroquinate synthase
MTDVVTVRGEKPYDVWVGSGTRKRVVDDLPAEAERVLLVHTAVLATHVEELRADIAATGRTVVLAEVPDAEAGKTAEVLAFCWQVLGRSDFTRTDVIVGVGGGAITDLAGFVAASWLRGVKVIHVPTTLQAMVDAAIGGKTGINTAEGKNLVGAFFEPSAVVCDLDFLVTQPRHDLVAGLAEVAKIGFIRDPSILDDISGGIDALSARTNREPVTPQDLELLGILAGKAIRVKADVVTADFREGHLREILNYGHTLGHAIEHVERYQWRHGAAVSVGMVFAAELARLAGTLDDAVVDIHRSTLSGLGLPVSYAPGRWDALHAAMRRDKKTRGSVLRFVVLEDLGRPTRLEGPDPALLTAAYAALSEA